MISYLVSYFAKGELSNLVKECFGTDFPNIFKKKQVDYIYRYLKDLNAKSVLLEPKYIDKDYLEDFNHYYVKCFGNNGSMTARLHFFSETIDHQKITELLADGKSESIEYLQASYLGFIVIKPLEKTFIGKTCLKTYLVDDKLNGSKCFLSREYKVDLFGIPLIVNSVAFQEQDKVVSACATTAIWSALHAMYWKSIREIRSCSEITTNAINHISNSNNSFPNRELSNKQILRALDFEKLKHHTEDLVNYSADDFFTTVKTHIDSKIPLILGVDVYSINDEELVRLDGHAITVVGYKLRNNKERAIYVHDDRLGPYARAAFTERWVEKEMRWGLILQEKTDDGDWKKAHELLVLNSLIIPAPHKVRLPSRFAQKTGVQIQSVYDSMLNQMALDYTENKIQQYRNQLTFNICLQEISDIRQELYHQKYLDDEIELMRKEKVKFLTGSYARYQWVASFSFSQTPIFKILFDATDIPQGNVVSAIFKQNIMFADFVLDWHKKIIDCDISLIEEDTNSFYGSFLKYLKPKADNLDSYLNDMYGELRAPKYIKDTELKNGNIINSSVDKYYSSVDKTLDDIYSDIIPEDPNSFLIWTISSEGVLLIGREESGRGHPTLTGFKPSRIAGELKRSKNSWFINSKSGRYSTDYSNVNDLLDNAAEKFKDIFRYSRENVFAQHFKNKK